MLENELSEHWRLYEENLKEIRVYLERREVLHDTLLDYSLDLGPQICEAVEEYVSFLNFVYQSDNWGGCDNYWSSSLIWFQGAL